MARRFPALDRAAPVPLLRRSRPIDLVHLAKQCLGDAALEHEVLRLFDTTIKTYLTRLLAAEAPDQVLFALHTIKGAAVGVGAFTIADLAKGMEADARAGVSINPEQIDDLKMAVEEVSVFVSDVLDKDSQ
ncbi:putative Hpt domain protein [Devosia sp. LC5]|uniref:Hpt domain-containing protein n=1 Tax=Devosia sp. LC5 TaxID=1502724 RepID=UPI0004E2E611|nr:Hpt domain-containing protein [Devosia sp. LC5]KFC66290.1 putative Hpt domain protein [Devosia sp. LC5]